MVRKGQSSWRVTTDTSLASIDVSQSANQVDAFDQSPTHSLVLDQQKPKSRRANVRPLTNSGARMAT